jgi:hypothetical protein
LQWSAGHLDQWYDIDPPKLNEDQRGVAASLLWLLSGDAAERARVSWSMGWPEAQKVSGTDWQAPYLVQLLDDAYPAVRWIARRSLRTLPGFGDLKVDVVGNRSDRLDGMASVIEQWRSQSHSDNAALLIQSGGPQIERIEKLLQQRDETPINLAE